jgi:PAS domain S-box-containing protein
MAELNPDNRGELSAQARLVLIETGRVLTKSLDYETTLQNVAQLVVPALADWCVVDLVQEGHLKPVAAMHTEREKIELIHKLRRQYPQQINNRIGAPNVVRTGQAELYKHITDEHFQQVASDPEHLAILRGLKLRSGVVVPLTARGQQLGAITLISERPESYTEADVPFIEELGRRCGVAVDNARLYESARQSERRYRTLFDSIDEGFCIIQMLFDEAEQPYDYRFLEMNAAFADQTDLGHVPGRTIRELVPNIESHWLEIYGRVALTGEPTRFTHGSEAIGKWFNAYAFRMGDPEERQVAILSSDITERKQAEDQQQRLLREVQAERQQLTDIFQHAPSFMCILRGPDHVFERANKYYRQLVGYRDLIGKTAREALPEIEEQGFFDLLDHVYQTGEMYRGNDVHIQLQRDSDGKRENLWLNFVYQPLRNAEGEVDGIFVQGVDLTERKEAEEAMQRSGRRQRARAEELKALMDSVPAVVFHAQDPEARQITGSEYAHQLLGVPRESNLSRTAPPRERPAHFRVCRDGKEVPGEQLPVQRAARGEHVYGEELEIVFEDGTWQYHFGNAVPLHDDQGEPRGAIAAMIDITQQKQAEQQLQRLNQTLEQRVAERTADAEQRAEQLQAMTSELTRAEERERRRLAKVLHDHLQQLLAASKMQMNMLSKRAGAELQKDFDNITQMLSDAIDTSRNLTVELSPPILYEGGLLPALRWLSRWMADKYNLSVNLEADQTIELNNEDLRILVFQSVRELLFNAAKYANVGEAELRVCRADEGCLEVTVADEGAGFDTEKARHHDAKGGFGLFSIRERLELMGGKLDLWSRPGQGTRATLRVAVEPKPQTEDSKRPEGGDSYA